MGLTVNEIIRLQGFTANPSNTLSSKPIDLKMNNIKGSLHFLGLSVHGNRKIVQTRLKEVLDNIEAHVAM